MRPPQVEPVTAKQAAARLGKEASTIRYWAIRYDAVQLKKIGRVVYYDFGDLAIIDREIRHRHPVPATPQERQEIRLRCPLRHAGLADAA